MNRFAAFCLVVAACAGSREVSKLRYTSTDCPDPQGCEVKPGENGYQPPDEAHDPAAIDEKPSCKTVAVALTSLELGNYSTEETEDERPTMIAKYRSACEGAKLDATETACLSTVTDVQHVGYCTKKMGERVTMLDSHECWDALSKMRPQFEASNQLAKLPAYESSCREDGWSHELASCFVERGYSDPMLQCSTMAPSWLFQQIQARIDKIPAQPQ
jgi:hypothetical protein